MFTLISILLLILFAYVDVWYFIRLGVLLVPHLLRPRGVKKVSRDELLQPSSLEGVVLPFDLDLQCHMNNSKYLREMDFARILFYVQAGLFSCIKATGGNTVVAATTIRYRRSLQLWQRFSLQTRILCWREDSFYVEQRFVDKGGITCAVALLQMCVKGTTATRILEKLCTDSPESPSFPPEVESWEKTIALSKEKMKRERTGN